MQYALLIYENAAAFASRESDDSDAYLGAWRAYHKALVEAGIYAGGNPLQAPETGTTVRQKAGKRDIQDGPYANTKEQLGGFIILELESLDAALEWAARCPAASYGAVEVRAISFEDQQRVTAAGANPRVRGLAEEAVWLARVLRDQVPDKPDVRGLLALMLHCEARRPARRGSDGRFIPLSEQDPRAWITPMIEEAERELAMAARQSRPGRFQIEAAIQSVHAERARSGRTDWEAIAVFYERIVQLSPTLGARVARAAARAEVNGAESGLSLLDEIEPESIISYQPYWAVRAHLLQQLHRGSEASEAFNRAIGLTEDDAVRRFLLERRGQ